MPYDARTSSWASFDGRERYDSACALSPKPQTPTHANADILRVIIEWSFAQATMSRYPHHGTLLRT